MFHWSATIQDLRVESEIITFSVFLILVDGKKTVEDWMRNLKGGYIKEKTTLNP